MRYLTRFIRNSISYIFIFVMLWIIASVLFFDGENLSINNNNPILLLIIAVTIVSALVIGATRLKNKCLNRPWIVLFCIVVIILALVTIFLRTKFDVAWDPGVIYRSVYAKITDTYTDSEFSWYFNAFPFQLFILYFYYFVCKIALTILPFLTVGAIMYAVNCLFVIVSVVFFVLSARCLFKNDCFARVVTYFYVLATPVLLYAAVIYTDTASLSAVSALLYLISVFYTKKKIGVYIFPIFGLLILFGFLLKATAVIIGVAFFITLLLSKMAIKKKIIVALFIICPFILGNLAWTSFYAAKIEPSKVIPKTHWLKMGLAGHGGYNNDDFVSTQNAIYNNEDVNKNCIEEIKKRLTGYGLLGYLRFLSRKISYTWGDGTYYIPYKLSRSPIHPDNILSDIFNSNGKYNGIYIRVAGALHLAMLVILLIGAFLTRNYSDNITLICKLSIIGIFIFFLFWETRSRYILNYTPVMFVLAGIFFKNIIREFTQMKLRHRYITLLSLSSKTNDNS